MDKKYLDPQVYHTILTLPVFTLFESHVAQAHLQYLDWPHHASCGDATRGDARRQGHTISHRRNVIASRAGAGSAEGRSVQEGVYGVQRARWRGDM